MAYDLWQTLHLNIAVVEATRQGSQRLSGLPTARCKLRTRREGDGESKSGIAMGYPRLPRTSDEMVYLRHNATLSKLCVYGHRSPSTMQDDGSRQGFGIFG